MSGLFETISFKWNGRTYELMPTVGLIGRVEEVLTHIELYQFLSRRTYPFAKLSMAYGIMLREAGCRVSDDDVYKAMFASSDKQDAAASAISALMQMMMPKMSDEEIAEAEKKA